MRFDEWQDSNGVPVASGAGGAFSAPGTILQVVSATKVDTFSTTSTTFGTITDLSISITPTSTSSKILMIATVNIATAQASNYGLVKLRRSSTDIGVGTPVGSRIGVSTMTAPTNSFSMIPVTAMVLDSPATTSATTYDVQLRSENANIVYVNRSINDRDASTDGRGASTITLMEVAG
jgi:hypothetical protein